MAYRGFKSQDILAFYQCTSKHTSMQMTATDVHKTSRTANLRIYVEQAIARMENFLIIKHKLLILLLHLRDDITVVCAVMTDFMEPLCSDH